MMGTMRDTQDDWAEQASEALDPVQRDAIRWFTVISDGQASEATRAAHRLWLEASPEHARSYVKVEALWAGAASLKARKPAGRSLSRRRFGQLVILAIAGSASYAAYRQTSAPGFQTARGETRSVVLADGSRLEMSGATALSVEYTPVERRVSLLQGEAYFTVAPDAQRPFTVRANDGLVTALGTEFNISAMSDQLNVVVAEHAVMVAYAGETRRLDQGQQLICRDRRMGAVRDADVDTEIAWRSGRLVFAGRPFGEVLEVLNRWSPQRLILMDDRLASHVVTLIVRTDDIAGIVPQLAQVLPISTRRVPLWGTLIYASGQGA